MCEVEEFTSHLSQYFGLVSTLIIPQHSGQNLEQWEGTHL